MSEPTVECPHCGDPVAVDEHRCPDCGGRVPTARFLLGRLVVLGMVVPTVLMALGLATLQVASLGVLPLALGVIVFLLMWVILLPELVDRVLDVRRAKREAR